MPRADHKYTTEPRAPGPKTRAQPTGGEQLAIDRLREIAARAGDALFIAGEPPHADRELLDLCTEVVHLARKVDKAFTQRREIRAMPGYLHKGELHIAHDTIWHKELCTIRSMAQLLRKAKNLRATTPAGIYAKALAVRSSMTGARHLAHSLAVDLLACEPLRRALWPAEAV